MSSRFALLLVIPACGLAASAGLTGSTTSGTSSGGAPSVGGSGQLVVPDVMGKTEAEARALARAAGFTADVELNAALACDGGPKVKDHVSCQTPDPGSKVSRGAWIQIAIYKPWDHPGMLVRDQLLPLVGLTVEQAKQQLAQLGYDGNLVVSEQYHYDDKCGQNKVCGVEPEAGIGLHDELRLSINKKLTIAAPPP